MTDNRPAEEEAESLIKSRLLKHKFNVTKPSFDKEGADLLIVDSISGKTTKFLKIQCKLRTIGQGKSSYVEIICNYVTDNFILFLYISKDDEDEVIYTFFKEDIETWKVSGNSYVLALSEASLKKLSHSVFDKEIAVSIKERLQSQPTKEYVSIIIDGIFLEKAIRETEVIYSTIWPGKKILMPSVKDLIAYFLYYNPFKITSNDVHCRLLLSEYHNLENVVDFSGVSMFAPIMDGVKLSINKTDKIICFEVLSELERIINAENIILIADDPAYQGPLLELAEKGVDLVVYKMKHDSGSQMYTKLRYQDIVYPLGRAMGLEGHEL